MEGNMSILLVLIMIRMMKLTIHFNGYDKSDFNKRLRELKELIPGEVIYPKPPIRISDAKVDTINANVDIIKTITGIIEIKGDPSRDRTMLVINSEHIWWSKDPKFSEKLNNISLEGRRTPLNILSSL